MAYRARSAFIFLIKTDMEEKRNVRNDKETDQDYGNRAA